MSGGLRIEGLVRQFRGNRVLDGLDVELPAGSVLSVLGPSGCGKSTLLSLVAGMDRPDAGRIWLDGRLLSADGVQVPPERRGINMVFQDYALWPHMKVEAIVGYGLDCRGTPRPERRRRVLALLEMLQIAHLAERFPGQLSGGQQQRVAIARALSTEPRLLLLDEPLSNLDVQLRLEMREELASLFQRLRTTALYVTHDAVEASSLADLVIVLRAGRIVQQGAPEALFANPGNAWVARLAGHDTCIPARVEAAAAAPGYYSVRVGTSRLVARIPDAGTASGASVSLLLHPASARLVTAAAPLRETENCLEGRTVRAQFEGRDWRVSVALGEAPGETPGETLTMNVMHPERVEVGQEAKVAFAIAETLAFMDETDREAHCSVTKLSRSGASWRG